MHLMCQFIFFLHMAWSERVQCYSTGIVLRNHYCGAISVHTQWQSSKSMKIKPRKLFGRIKWTNIENSTDGIFFNMLNVWVGHERLTYANVGKTEWKLSNIISNFVVKWTEKNLASVKINHFLFEQSKYKLICHKSSNYFQLFNMKFRHLKFEMRQLHKWFWRWDISRIWRLYTRHIRWSGYSSVTNEPNNKPDCMQIARGTYIYMNMNMWVCVRLCIYCV